MRHEHEAVRVVDADRVRVARRRDHLDRLADLAVRADRVHAHLVRAIGRAEQKAAGAVDRDVGIALRERALADELQRARVLVDGVGVGLVRLRAHGRDEEALVRTHRHRHHDLCGVDARARLERAVRLQRVHPDIAVLGVGDVDERGGKRGRARHGQHDRKNRHFHWFSSLSGDSLLRRERGWPDRPAAHGRRGDGTMPRLDVMVAAHRAHEDQWTALLSTSRHNKLLITNPPRMPRSWEPAGQSGARRCGYRSSSIWRSSPSGSPSIARHCCRSRSAGARRCSQAGAIVALAVLLALPARC